MTNSCPQSIESPTLAADGTGSTRGQSTGRARCSRPVDAPRRRRSPMLRWLSASVAGLFGLSLLTGCLSWKHQAERYLALEPTRYVIAYPEGREQWSTFQDLVDRKRAQGFEVELLPFRMDIEPAERFAAVSRELVDLREPSGSAYLLILASHEELPMGAWPIRPSSKAVYSDLPLLAGVDRLGEQVGLADWKSATEFPPPWIAGRIPWSSEELVAAMLEGSASLDQRRSGKVALVGAERFSIPHDSAWVMSGVDDALEGFGWESTLLSEDWPRDARLDGCTLVRTTQLDEEDVEHVTQRHLSFLSSWAQSAPNLVYLVAHSNRMILPNPSDDRTGPEFVSLFGVGEHLIDPEAFLRFEHESVHAVVGAPPAPSSPALLMTTGCGTGSPRNVMLSELTRRGWVGGIWTSTHTNGPVPLFAAIRAERTAPRYIAAGLPIGLAHQATINAYLSDSARDPSGWLLGPASSRQRELNVLSYTIYGDPSIRIAEQ